MNVRTLFKYLPTLAAVAVASLLCVPVASAAQPANQAVVLVSGLNSPTPFSTPAPQCAGQEGDIWGVLIAPQLKSLGYNVYTAPESKGSQTIKPCGGNPPPPTYMDATKGIDSNGTALANYLAWLNQNFGITQVQLVAHSYGGLWSRSAITQNTGYSQNLTISSLTTLGSPQTGAFTADIAEGVSGLDCNGGPVYKAICSTLQALANASLSYLGPEAVSELTSTYVGSWNPQQSIGSCQVTPLAGNHVSLGSFIDKLVGSYYLPNDGLVGVGSAAATTAPSPFSPPAIPALQPVTQFDVVHSAALSFISSNNLLNQQAIVNRIAQALGATDIGTSAPVNCVKNPVPPPPPPTPPVPVNPITPIVPNSNGNLPKPGRYDVLYLASHSRVYCGRRLVNSQPGIRRGKEELVIAPRCSKRLRVARGKVMMLRRAAGKKVTVTAGNGVLTVKVSGKGPRTKLAAAYIQGKGWKPAKLNRAGQTPLPTMAAGDTSLPVRVTIKTPKGGRSFAVAVVKVPTV